MAQPAGSEPARGNPIGFHIAGSRNIIADTLSRTVHWSPKEEGTEEEEWSKIEQGFARQVTGDKHSFLWKDPLMKEVTQQVQVDKDYMNVLELVKSKRDKVYIKTKVKSDHPAKAYWKVWDRLGYEEDPESKACLMTLDATRICIPRGVDEMGVSDGHFRRKIVQRLHGGGQGRESCREALLLAQHVAAGDPGV